MSTHDRYVADPTERPPRDPRDRLRPVLALAVTLLLLAAMVMIRLVDAREDPSLQIPQDLLTPVDPSAPAAPSLDGS